MASGKQRLIVSSCHLLAFLLLAPSSSTMDRGIDSAAVWGYDTPQQIKQHSLQGN